jgi:hypothetical protein
VEFRSKGFSRDQHDPEKCDLIVCWEHNWPQAPVPVLELFTGELTGLKDTPLGKASGELVVPLAKRRSTNMKGLTDRTKKMLRAFDEQVVSGMSRREAIDEVAARFGVKPATVAHHEARLRRSEW